MASPAVARISDITAGVIVGKKPVVPSCERNGVENNSQFPTRAAYAINNGEAHGGTPRKDASLNGHGLVVSSADKGGMSDELKDIFNKLIDSHGHLDMRNVTTLIWVNRKKPEIVETIVELLIENSNERRVFNGIEFYLPQLAHMIVHLDVHLPSSALEQFALVVCQQSLHVALQLNWILVAALEDYHAELPDGSRNKKANTVYFNRCAKLLQNVERIIALGAPSAAGLEELYATGKLSRHEVETRTIAERRKQAEKVISSPKRGVVPVADELHMKGWLWHKRWHKRGFPHKSRWLRRWFEVEDRVLYCYSSQAPEGSRVKRAAVLYQASVVVCDYKDGRYPFYFEVHSPMGNMRLRAEDAAAKDAWVSSLQKQAKAMPPVAHLYSNEGAGSSARQSLNLGPQLPAAAASDLFAATATNAGAGQITKHRSSSFTIAEEGATAETAGGGGGRGGKATEGCGNEVSVASAIAKAASGEGGTAAAADAAAKELLASTADTRKAALRMGTVVQMEAKRNKRFRFFNDERKFVSSLTDVCEALRFVEDRSKRPGVLESLLMAVEIPECVYLPLCRSTEPFQRVLKITANEAKAFSTKERVPTLVTFETEQTYPPGSDPKAAPLDVASFLHFVYGSYAPVHQDQQRYSSVALRGGEDSIMEPDLLAVGDGREGEEASQPGHRTTRSGSFLFRAGSKGLPFTHMASMHLPGNFSTVWRDKPAGPDASKAKEARGTKSPFRHNLSSLGSALHARASSIRNVKLSGVLHSVSKRGAGLNTPGSVAGSTATAPDAPADKAVASGEEKSADPALGNDSSAELTEVSIDLPTDADEGRAKRGSGDALGSAASGKSVAWEDGGGNAQEKVTLPDVNDPPARERWRGSIPGDMQGEVKAQEGDAVAVVMPGDKVGGWAGEGLERHGSAVVLKDGSEIDEALRDKDSASAVLSSPRRRDSVTAGEVAPGGVHEVPLESDQARDNKVDASALGSDSSTRTKRSKAYGESMAVKAQRIRKQSVEGTRVGWTLQRLIVKSNDDVRQEVFIMQLITFYKEVFEREGLDLFLKPYSILSTAKTTGLIEFLNQATSMDGLKKSEGYAGSLLEHFYAEYGPAESAGFKAAQRKFMTSLAGYSVASYLLRIKDRHNGNVMIDSDGHIVHIDFGFVLGSAPGKKFSMERAAFKMTPEYMAVLGGKGSPLYEEFVDLFTKGILAARKYARVTITMIEIMMFKSEFPCFEYSGEAALTGFKKRLMLGLTDSDVKKRARKMVEHADGHWGTCFYDKFQLWTNGIVP